MAVPGGAEGLLLLLAAVVVVAGGVGGVVVVVVVPLAAAGGEGSVDALVGVGGDAGTSVRGRGGGTAGGGGGGDPRGVADESWRDALGTRGAVCLARRLQRRGPA